MPLKLVGEEEEEEDDDEAGLYNLQTQRVRGSSTVREVTTNNWESSFGSYCSKLVQTFQHRNLLQVERNEMVLTWIHAFSQVLRLPTLSDSQMVCKRSTFVRGKI